MSDISLSHLSKERREALGLEPTQMTPRRWVIGMPAWSAPYHYTGNENHYLEMANNVSLPAIAAALRHSNLPVHLVIHTNKPEAFSEIRQMFDFVSNFSVEFRPIQTISWHQYSLAHFEVAKMATRGDFVSLLPADAVISREFFAACESRLLAGKKIVVGEGSRTWADGCPPPIGATGRELTDWSVKYLHQCMKDAFWGTGKTMVHSTMYFADGDNLVKHCFHYGPMGYAVDGREYKTGGDSSDGTFMDSFRLEEVHIAQPDELAIVECSPKDKSFGTRDHCYTKANVVEWAKTNTTWIHRFMFLRPVVLQGVDTGKSQAVVEEIVGALRS